MYNAVEALQQHECNMNATWFAMRCAQSISVLCTRRLHFQRLKYPCASGGCDGAPQIVTTSEECIHGGLQARRAKLRQNYHTWPQLKKSQAFQKRIMNQQWDFPDFPCYSFLRPVEYDCSVPFYDATIHVCRLRE